MAEKKGCITWGDLWAIRAMSSPIYQDALDREIGYAINPETGKVTLTPEFHRYACNASITELKNFLSGAPMPILKLYLHMLPLKYVKQVALCYRKSQLDELTNAYYSPTMIDDKAHLLGESKP